MKKDQARGLLGDAKDLQRRVPLLQIGALAILYAAGVATIQGFGERSSINSMLVLASFLGIAAAGQTIVILLGGIDLSVPNIIGATNLITTDLGTRWNFAVLVVTILSVAFAIGAANGFLAHHFRVPPLIITLGSGSMVAGAVLAGTHASVYGQVPSWLTRSVSPIGTVAGVKVPPIVVFWAVFAIVVAIVLHLTGVGRRLYATGANEGAARLALVRTELVWVVSFGASAVCSAIVGIFLAAWSGTGDQSIGDPYLFLSIAAVIVGGTSLVGARGDYWRTVLGALILTVLTTFFVGQNYSQASQQILLGVLILVVVATYGRDRHLRDRI